MSRESARVKVFVIMVLRGGAWRPTSNIRLTRSRAEKLLAHLNARIPGVRRRVCEYGPTL